MLPSDLTLTLGARFTAIENKTDFEDFNNWKESKPTLSASLVYNGINNTTLRTSYSQGFKAPSLGQLYGTGTSGGFVEFLPNYDLKHETSDNFEIGARYANDRAFVDFAVYYTEAKDYIGWEFAPDFSWYRNVNFDHAKLIGSELYADYRVEDNYNLTPYGSLTLSRNQSIKGDFKTWDTKTPLFDGKVGLKADKRFSNGINWWGDLNMRFTSEADHKSSASAEVVTYEGYQTVNIGTGITYGSEQQVYASLNLNNLLNKTYYTTYSNLEAPGFHAVAQLGLRF